MRRVTIVVIAALAGLIVAGVASSLIAEALRDPLLRECVATGKLTFDKPIPESAAKAIHDQCRAELARRDVLARSTLSFGLSLISLVVVTAVRLLDPIHDLIALACGVLVYLLIARLWPAAPRLQATTEKEN
jgi:hypothetical protein